MKEEWSHPLHLFIYSTINLYQYGTITIYFVYLLGLRFKKIQISLYSYLRTLSRKILTDKDVGWEKKNENKSKNTGIIPKSLQPYHIKMIG